MKTLMRKTIQFGKIAYSGKRKVNAVDVEIELHERGGDPVFIMVDDEKIYTGETTPTYTELSICGNIWNSRHTDVIFGGQCLDVIAQFVHSRKFQQIHQMWKRWHLNGMHAGTPEQESAVHRWSREHGGKYEYTKVCEYLKQCGLYQVCYTGKSVGRLYDNEPYLYGSAWLVEDLPEWVIKWAKEV